MSKKFGLPETALAVGAALIGLVVSVIEESPRDTWRFCVANMTTQYTSVS
jgi:hypothetical protein